jgi:4-amino-4-deoxy-L-arabinose transferase-like glycosyltransferase
LKFVADNLLKHRRFIYYSKGCLVFLLLCRLLANTFVPLNDTTEARYAEIARKMLETGNWITLQQDYGVPFWAKPPLSTWLTAASMHLFGVNEFAARCPSLLLSLLVMGLIGHLAKRQGNDQASLIALLVLAGSFYFFLDAGAVMTEPALVFATTLSMVSFWFAIHEDDRGWSYCFFIGLGLGLLAKGPIALVLVGVPIFFWVLWRRAWGLLWHRLPWILGTLLLCLIALPWYVLAEQRTPGFLNYFILGEHLQRFLTPGWSGDKYGFAHQAPKGMIWIYAIIGVLPWTPVFGLWLIKYKIKATPVRDQSGWISYLMLFTLMPLVFFTFAGNIIYPYTFPMLAPFALLFTEFWKGSDLCLKNSLWLPFTALIAGICCLIAVGFFIINPNQVAKTQKPVIDAWRQQHPRPSSTLVYWGQAPDFSAQFYAQGAIVSANTLKALCQLKTNKTDVYLVVYSNYLDEMPRNLVHDLTLERVINLRKNRVLLFRWALDSTACN